MNALVKLSPFAQTVIVLAAAVIAIGGLRAISEIATPFLLAALIAVVAIPLEVAMQRRGVGKLLAFGLTFLICAAVVFAVAFFFGVAVQQVARGLVNYEDEIRTLIADVEAQAAVAGIVFSTDSTTDAGITASNIIQIVQSAVNFVVNSTGSVVLIFLFLLYFLMEGDELATRVRAALGEDHPTLARMRAFMHSTRQYLLSRTVFGLIIAGIQTTLMLAMGVNFAVLWGILSFICNFIPNIGFVIGIIPPAILLLVEQGPVPTLIFVVAYSVINNVIENLIAPRYVGQQVNLSPLTTFLSLTLWAWVLGAAGAFLAVPLTLLVKLVLLDADPGARGMVALMSAVAPAAPPLISPVEETD